MEILKANLDVIAAGDAALAARLRSYQGPSVAVEAARSGGATFRLSGRLFHSAYAPEKEAAAQAAEILSKKPDWVLIFGLGCGHLLAALIEGGHDKVIAYEPSMEILSGVLASVDLSGPLSAKHVRLHADAASLVANVRELDGFDTLLSYATVPYKTAFSGELVDFTSRVNNAHTTNKVCIITDLSSRESWIENYFANIGSLCRHAPIDALRGAFKGVPVIVAGAGPSLQKNAHILKEARGKAIIIAAITAYRPLLRLGVVPDFVIASEKVDLPEYFTYGEDDRKTRLILAEVSHPGMFERDVKEKFVFFNPYVGLSQAHAGLWGSSYFPSTGGSVTTAALDMGVMMGCDPLVLVGQDLSFGENSTHAPGGVYISQEVRIDREAGKVSIDEDYVTLKDKAKSSFDLLWLKGLDGKPVASKFDWVTFHHWFEGYVANARKQGLASRFINATEGGAYIDGWEHLALAEVIGNHAKNEVPVDDIIAAASASRPAPDLPGLASSIGQMHKALKEIGRFADAISKEVASVRKDLCRDGGIAGANRRAGKIKRTEERLFSAAQGSPFIWEALTEGICELKEYLRGASGDGDGGIEKDIETIYQAYRKVSAACTKYAPVLARAAAAIEGRIEGKKDPQALAAV